MTNFLFPVHGEETVEEAKAERESRLAAVERERLKEECITIVWKTPGVTTKELLKELEASGAACLGEDGRWRVGSKET